jgi:hypothetical protein
LASFFLATILIVATISLHYEALRLMSALVSRSQLRLRVRVLFVVLGCFAAHLVEIGLYAAAYLGMDHLGLGSIQGNTEGSAIDYLYFSATSFSTLGFGDVYPTGVIRLISGFEAVNGLFLIAWSTSFTYLAMERLWPLHSRLKIGDEENR